MDRLRKLLRGGSDGNEQLTASVGALLLVLLAVEGATLLRINSLLDVHAFVGMLLIPVVALKLGSAGWRMIRYYLGGEEYVLRGPPHAFARMLVAPVVVVSTVVLFATGVALLVTGEVQGTIVGLHKASFVVWFGAMSVHVLMRVWQLPRIVRTRLPGVALRVGLVGGSLACGLVLATLTLPAVDRLQDGVTAHAHLDAG